MGKAARGGPQPGWRERLVDATWSTGTNVASGILILVAAWGFGEVTGVTDRILDSRCSDYASQRDAQAEFDDNEAALVDLDRDGDGIACEALR